jgi:hypothetical protein
MKEIVGVILRITRRSEMSDAKHTGEDKIQFHLDREMTEQLDMALKKLKYKSRAEWFREKARETIKEASQK